MLSIIALLLLILAGYFWFSTMKAKEIAVKASKNACASRGLQFLDDTVFLKNISFKRGSEGHLQWQRTYQFEYYQGEDIRQTSTITLNGATIIALSLAPKNNVIQFSQARNDMQAFKK